MAVIIRDVDVEDLDAVLVLNQSETPHVGSVGIDRMRWFARHASYFRVALLDGALAGFLVGLRPGSSYDSPNYRWFCERYEDFGYIDRVAVAGFARRSGIASQLYEDFAATLPESAGVMTCEVNVRPANDASMQYHRRAGFHQVGTLTSDGGAKEVAMLLKDLQVG